MAKQQQQLIWIGAGSATQPVLNLSQFSKVTLIDAREEVCNALVKQYTSAAIQVKHLAIAANVGAVTLYRYNLPEFAATAPVTGLKQLFPGLKATQTETLSAQSITAMLAELGLDGGLHTLVLDTPAQALSLLQALVNTQQLGLFQHIYLPYSTSELYQDMAPFELLSELLAEHYYQLSATDNTDPDLPIYTFTLDHAARQLAQLNQQVKDLTEQLAAAAELLTQTQQQAAEKQKIEQQKTELAKQLDTVKQQQAADKQQLELQKAELTQQLQTVKQQQAADKQQLELQKAELTQQLETVKQQQAADKQQLELQKAELTQQLEAVKHQQAVDNQQSEQQKADLSKQLEQVKLQNAELMVQLQQEQSLHKATAEKLAEVQSWLQSRKNQALELEEQLKIAQTELTLLRNQQVTNASIEALQASMQTLFQQQAQQQAQQLQQAANALGQHVTKMQHEQQSSLQHYLGLQRYLQTGEPILRPDSWAIAADTLTELVTLLNTNNYDVIIEFGSGQSTTVIAKTLAHQNTELQQLVNNYRLAHKGRKSTTTEISTEHFVKDLPARIVSFEQSENYLNKTRQQLNEHGLAQFVELVLAPLVPASYANQLGTEPLFYNCNDKLAELAKVLANRQARILVVVDGPCSPIQDPLIRYAALPAILNNLAAHKLHVLLDDTKREGEQLVLKHWQQLCEQRGLQTKLTTWPTQKGAVLLEVTP